MKYGFIGCGNMGGAILRSLSKATKDILISDPSTKAAEMATQLGVEYADNAAVITNCQRIFLAVKPQMLETVLKPLGDLLMKHKPQIITIAAGVTIEHLLSIIGTQLPVIRLMPNTPVAVGMGMIVYCANPLTDASVLADFLEDMRYTGKLSPIDEKLIDVASALSGSGPAYFYMAAEALADGAVACGLPRAAALEYAAMTMAGAAKMLLETGEHPGVLKDQVCSPGGSTIAAVRVLEQNNYRSALTECICAAYEKNKKLI